MRCMDCWNSCANAAIMWQCLPVPVFGNHTSTSVRVATVGLNPSATEFLYDKPPNKHDWKSKTERLPLVIDFDVRERDQLSAANLERAAHLRATYFEHMPHFWFNKIQELMSEVNAEWNYAAGKAVHIDIVACGTWQAWSNLSTQTTKAMVANCHNYLKRTLTELPNGTLLLLDGREVNTTLAANFGIEEPVEELIGHVTVWRGSLQIEDRCFKYKGWSKPINYLPLSSQRDLVRWLRGEIAQ